jgi:hypothetical protein
MFLQERDDGVANNLKHSCVILTGNKSDPQQRQSSDHPIHHRAPPVLLDLNTSYLKLDCSLGWVEADIIRVDGTLQIENKDRMPFSEPPRITFRMTTVLGVARLLKESEDSSLQHVRLDGSIV